MDRETFQRQQQEITELLDSFYTALQERQEERIAQVVEQLKERGAVFSSSETGEITITLEL